MTCSCGCCAGCGTAAPRRMRNRPGLPRIETRPGTHASLFEAMVARLSLDDHAPLAGLKARSLDDASIALIDAWALVADVLGFYQERIANEAYLRTATERRSLVEISRLVGYRPRPGVAASAHLAFTLENESDPAEIPEGTRVNSVPGPGEKMVAFETGEAIAARLEWNAIRPRLARPQARAALDPMGPGLYLKGTRTRLKPNDPLLVRVGGGAPRLAFIHTIAEDHDLDRTLVRFAPPATMSARDLARSMAASANGPGERRVYGIPTVSLSRAGATAPGNAADLPRSLETSFSSRADTLPKLLGAVQPALGRTLYQAMRNAPALPQPEIEVRALRIDARPFGHNAPLHLVGMNDGAPVMNEWPVSHGGEDGQAGSAAGARASDEPGHGPRNLYLDNDYDVRPEDIVVILTDGEDPILLGTPEAREKEELKLSRLSLSAYGMSGKSVLVHWEPGDKDPKTPVWIKREDDLAKARRTRVFTGSEELELADAPILDDVFGDRVELDGLYDGLEPGRWLIVEGERTDIVDAAGRIVPGVRAAELVMLLAIEQSSAPFPGAPVDPATGGGGRTGAAAPSQKLRTILTLAAQSRAGPGLAYRYRRETVLIHANVARATHGETRTEILGSGDASASLQTFILRQPPLTHVPAATPSGISSTLELRVNDLLWREAPSLAALGPADRAYLTRDDDDGVTSVLFGNGVRGARPPTGRENVRALYRSGIGIAGNVPAGRLSLLASRPLGVKGVVNPLRASGGADREDIASIRRNAPVALMALDRLVSTPDYAYFARAFGGIGKAGAVRASGEDVSVVVAGIADAPLEGSELLRNLADAMRRFGDPQVALSVRPRERLVLVIQANVRVDPDREWALVEPKVRSALLEEFGFEAVGIGEWLPLGRALRAIQAVEGVTYADIDVFDSLAEDNIFEGLTREVGGELERRDLVRPGADQIAYLAPDVPETVILRELKS